MATVHAQMEWEATFAQFQNARAKKTTVLRLEHDPEKYEAVFRKACPRARPEGSCLNKELERDDDSTKSHRALVASISVRRSYAVMTQRPALAATNRMQSPTRRPAKTK